MALSPLKSVLGTLGIALAWAVAADAQGEGRRLESVRLRNGSAFSGYVVREDDRSVEFLVIRRTPGKPVAAFPFRIDRAEVASVDHLAGEEHGRLKQWVEDLDLSGRRDTARREAVQVHSSTDFPIRRNGRLIEGQGYRLQTDLPDDLARRVAVRLDTLDLALARYFPPGRESTEPVSVFVFADTEAARQYLEESGKTWLNNAGYDARRHRIVGGWDLAKLGEDLERVRGQNRALMAELDQQEKAFRRLYGAKAELQRHLQPIQEMRQRVARSEARNDGVFAESTKILVRQLQHEMFHAYWCEQVFPSRRWVGEGAYRGDVPRWLNEGLAMVVEQGFVESNELRLGAADPERLARLQEMMKGQRRPILAPWLTERSAKFVLHRWKDRAAVEADYDTAWGVTHFLLLHLRRLERPDLERFVSALADGRGEVAAFEDLAGQKLPDFEAGWREYVERLKPDGTLRDVNFTRRP